MLIFITGATGLIGRRIVLDRLERGDRVLVLSRSADRANRMFATDVNPNIRVIEGDSTVPGRWQKFVDTCDVVIHLAGAGIADHRWTEAYKRELWNSRIDSTHQVVNAIESAIDKPRLLINASAVGFYGDKGEQEIDESADPPPRGRDFLADLCVNWEEQAQRAEEYETRTVMLRTGAVLDDRGGALHEMMRPFRLFVGGPIGSGRQWMSWIHYRDILGLIDLAIRDRALRGPINVVTPNPIRNREFMKTLGAAMNRPCWAPVPRLALRAVLGEFADYLFASQRVVPAKALDHGYHYLFPGLEDALRSLIVAIDRRRGKNGSSAVMMAYESIDVDLSGSSESHPFSQATFQPQATTEGGMQTATTVASRGRPKRAKPASQIRLLAVDVDGTLLRSDGRIAQSAIDACRAAVRAGVAVIPATARPPRSMQSIVQTLGLGGPTINYNGAVIWSPIERKAHFHEALDPEIVREIVAESRALIPDLLVSLEILDRWFTDRVDQRFHTETSRVFDPDFIGPLDSFLSEPVTKLMLLADPGALSPVMDMVRDRYWSQRRVAVFITDPHVIQIAHPRVDKAVALQRIAKRLDVARDEVMAIGDGANDAGMIEWSGFGVAVENACETVRNLADVIVPSNDENGTARAIQRFVLNAE